MGDIVGEEKKIITTILGLDPTTFYIIVASLGVIILSYSCLAAIVITKE